MPNGVTEEQVAEARNISVEQVRAIKSVRALNEEEILALPQDVLMRSLQRSQYPDMPGRRAAFRALQEKSTGGDRHPDARATAMVEMRAAHRSARAAVQPFAALHPEVAAAAHSFFYANWTPLGPSNIGGRTRAIVIHPTNYTMWTGSAGGGIWRSTDGGASWNPADESMPNLAVCCLAMDPTNPNLMYAGTGEGFNNLDAILGAGLFSSQDGGNTWVQNPAFATGTFNRLAVSADGTTVLAATTTGLFRCSEPSRSQWTTVLSGPVYDVKFHPTDPSKAVMAAYGTIGRSVDGGATWTQAVPNAIGNNRIELAYASANPSMIYASVYSQTTDANGNVTSSTSFIWRSADDGATFTQMTSLGPPVADGGYLGQQGWYGNSIWAGDPTNADYVYVGGIDLWTSVDGGNNLMRRSLWYQPGSLHADHHTIVAHPAFDGGSNRTVFLGNDGGVYMTDEIYGAGGNPTY